MKKRILALLMVLAIVMTLFIACNGDTGAQSDAPTDNTQGDSTEVKDDAGSANTDIDFSELSVGVVMKSFDEFQQSCMNGAKDAAIAFGIKEQNITLVAPNNESEIMAQVTMIEDLVAKGVDILLVSVNQADTVMNPLKAAHEKGVKIIFVDTEAPDFTDRVTYIGTDNETAAYDGAKEFSKMLDPASNVVILRGKLGDTNHEARTLGLTRALEEDGHTILEVQDANCESDKAASMMEAWLSKFAGEIDAVMVTSDSMAIGAAQAIKGVGLLDDIKICGFDGFQAAIDLVEAGEVEMIIAQNPYFMGYHGVECGIGALQGETFDKYIDPGISIINQDNYQEFR